MISNSKILSSIQVLVQQIVPTAQVLLFGSRANNTATEESDWDILVITQEAVTKPIKRNIQDAIFPLSVQIGAFINLLLVNENDWSNNPSYYSIYQTITTETIMV